MFLLSITAPNYDYLRQKWNINNKEELKVALLQIIQTVDLKKKSQDFEHLLFQNNSQKIILFEDFIKSI